jgi:UDP-GlcNAc:undecaprenyl-phosphate GlcNAc-1-phosphate transferase
MALFLSFLLSLFVTMVLIPPLMRAARRFQFVDVPDARKVHSEVVPRIGGVAMVAGALLPVALWLPASAEVAAFLVGAFVILIFGVWDDKVDLDFRIKFLGQTVAVAVVVGLGDVVIRDVPLLDIPVPDYIGVPLTVFFLLGVTNAVNLSDGLDGLAGGTALLAAGSIALMAYSGDNIVVALMSLAVIGSILGFLRFNTHPARIFMGDGGSQFLGFSLGVLSLMLTQQSGGVLSSALPLLLLALPIVDTLMVMRQRIAEGRSPFSPDKNHVHHKLLALGFLHYEAVTVIYVIEAGLALAAYSARFESDGLILAMFAGFGLAVMGFFHLAKRQGWQFAAQQVLQSASGIHGDQRRFSWSALEARLARAGVEIALFSLPVFGVGVAVFSEPINPEVWGLASLLCGLLVVVGWLRRGRPLGWVERGGIYLGASLVLYVQQVFPGRIGSIETLIGGYVVLLAVVVILGFRHSRNRRFEMTPLDFLIVFSAFCVPALPGFQTAGPGVGETIAKLIVLFYAIELVLNHVARWDRVRAVTLAVLGCVAVRGILMIP